MQSESLGPHHSDFIVLRFSEMGSWWLKPEISALERLRQEDCQEFQVHSKFQVSLSHSMRYCMYQSKISVQNLNLNKLILD